MRWVLRGVVVVLGVSLPLSTAARIQTWSDERLLWREAVAHSPEKPRPWINLGVQLARIGADDLAAQAYQQAAALALAPDRVAVEGPMRYRHVALLNLAFWHVQQGRYDDAFALTAEIQPRAEDGRQSPVTRLETQWRDEQRHGGPLPDF